MSAILKDSSNCKPKLKNDDTWLFIRPLFQNPFFFHKKKGFWSQLLYTTAAPSSTLDIWDYRLSSSWGSKKFYTFKPITGGPKGCFFLVNGFSTARRSILNETEIGIVDTDEMKKFYEWFSGFTDAEGSFYIAISNSCAFRFQINLHKQDIDALHYIQKSLGFGEVRSYNNFSSYTVTKIKDIAQLLEIFSRHPLQGSKWLNYRDFFKAYELYTKSAKGADTLKEIWKIKQNMNRSRLDFTMPKDHDTNISAYWLLGFVEGEGCFSINRGNNYRLDFSLCQSYSNLELMKKIKIYLENLPNGNYPGAIGISSVVSNNSNHQSVIRIETTRIPFITDIFIPFLDSLKWHSKKQLDFQDWKNILMLREQGHHLSEQGAKLIDLILSQMNRNRLLTNSGQPFVDRGQVLDQVNQLLSGRSNFEIRNDRKWVISLNKYYNSSRQNICVGIEDEEGNILHKFDSLADCAKFLNVKATTVSKRRIKGMWFTFDNKKVCIKKVISG